MKKSLLALAALTAFAGVASAQSSVTVFGIVDLSINRIKNGPNSMTLESSDQMNSNRLGFRGIEDLGGGMKAGFWLESGIGPDTGANGGSNGYASVMWNRRATVSLMGGFGEIRIGRDYAVTFNNRAAYDPFGFNGIAHMGIVENLLGSTVVSQVRINNAVSYYLPEMGGLYGQLQAAAGEGLQGNKYAGGRIGYAAGPLNISGAVGKTYKTGAMIDDFNQKDIGMSYNLGFMTIEGMYDKVDYGSADQKHALVGVLVPFGPGTLKASYNKVSGKTDSVGAKLFGIGYQYDLSKRTALYTTISRLQNDGNAATGAKFTVGQGPAMTIGGDTSSGFNVGIRHIF
jgi:predicted porin